MPTMTKALRFKSIGNLKVTIGNVKWSGREADRASSNSTLPDSHGSAGMSHAPRSHETGRQVTRRHGDKDKHFSPRLRVSPSPCPFLVPKDRRPVFTTKTQRTQRIMTSQVSWFALFVSSCLGGDLLGSTGTIIVHVHEEVLAPLGSCFGIVTKHDPFELHAQRRLRSQQWHSCFFRRAVALPVVALDTSRHDVYGRVITTTRTRQDMIER